MVSPSTDKAPSIVELTPETYQQDVSSDSIDLESGTKKLQNESALQSHEYTTNIDETSSSNTASKLTYIQNKISLLQISN